MDILGQFREVRSTNGRAGGDEAVRSGRRGHLHPQLAGRCTVPPMNCSIATDGRRAGVAKRANAAKIVGRDRDPAAATPAAENRRPHADRPTTH
jgi:hypothetical protein